MSAPLRLVSTQNLSREDWLAARQQGIGGSDAAASVGLCRYKSPLELWLEKTGRKPAADLSDNDAVYWGTVLEPVIADVYAQKTGARVRRVNAILQHPEHAFMLANLDRSISGHPDGSGLLEIKTAGWRSAPLWDQGVPDHYQCQVLHQLAITGKPWADVAVLIGGQDFRIYRIERDEEQIQALIQLEQQFWACVQNDVPPEADGSDSSGRALATLYPKDAGQTVDFSQDDVLNGAFESLLVTRQQLETVEAEEQRLKQQLEQAMGDATTAVFSQGKVTWKASKPSQSLDLDRLRQDHAQLLGQYSVIRPGSRRFNINLNTGVRHD